MTGGGRPAATGRWAGVVVFAALAGATLAVQPWSGPILLVFSSYHGIDLSDLLPAGFVLASGLLLVRALSGHETIPRTARRARAASQPLRRPAAVLAGLALGAASLVRMEDSLQPRPVETGITVAVLSVVGAWALTAVDRDLLLAALALTAGFLVDAVAVPTGTMFGPLALALYLAVREARLGNRAGAAVLVLAAVGFGGLSAGSLTDLAGLDERMAGSDGGPGRTGALGIVLVLHGLLGTPTGAVPADQTPTERAAVAASGR